MARKKCEGCCRNTLHLLPGALRGGDANDILELARLELLADTLHGKVGGGTGAEAHNHAAGDMVIDRLVSAAQGSVNMDAEIRAWGRRVASIPGELLGLVGGGHLGHHGDAGAAEHGGRGSDLGSDAGKGGGGSGEGRGAGHEAVERDNGGPHLCFARSSKSQMMPRRGRSEGAEACVRVREQPGKCPFSRGIGPTWGSHARQDQTSRWMASACKRWILLGRSRARSKKHYTTCGYLFSKLKKRLRCFSGPASGRGSHWSKVFAR